MGFVTFMTSMRGRMMRILAGVVLISLGLVVIKDTPGMVLALVALVPIAGGALDFCLVGTLLGYPLSGAKAREKLAQSRTR